MVDKEKQNKRQFNWKKENVDRIALEVPKGTKDVWKEAAAASGLSLNQYIIKKVNQPD